MAIPKRGSVSKKAAQVCLGTYSNVKSTVESKNGKYFMTRIEVTGQAGAGNSSFNLFWNPQWFLEGFDIDSWFENNPEYSKPFFEKHILCPQVKVKGNWEKSSRRSYLEILCKDDDEVLGECFDVFKRFIEKHGEFEGNTLVGFSPDEAARIDFCKNLSSFFDNNSCAEFAFIFINKQQTDEDDNPTEFMQIDQMQLVTEKNIEYWQKRCAKDPELFKYNITDTPF